MKSLRCQLVVVPALFLVPMASWSQHALTVPVAVVHTSNPNLAAVSDGTVSVIRVSPSYSIVKLDGALRTEVSLGAVLERSSNTLLSAHRSDPRLAVNWQWATPTSQIGIRGSLQGLSTRASEFDSTGSVMVDSTQRTTEVGADWSQDLSTVTRLALGVVSTQVVYETPLLVGYRESGASATIDHTLNEVSRISVAFNYGLLYPDDLRLFSESKRSSIFFGYDAALSELWTVGVGVGKVRTAADTSRSSTVGTLQLGYQGDRLSSSFDWRREVAPSGSLAGYGRTERYRWTGGYALTSETELQFSISRAKTLEERGGVSAIASILLRSALTDFWTVSMGYEARQTAPMGGPRAKGNAVSLGLTYTHPDF